MDRAYSMKLATRIVLGLMIVLGLVSCVSLYPPPNKAGILFTSPPHQTYVVMDAEDMTPALIRQIMHQGTARKFHDYQFSPSTSMVIDASGVKSNTDSRSSTTTASRAITITDNRPPDEKGL